MVKRKSSGDRSVAVKSAPKKRRFVTRPQPAVGLAGGPIYSVHPSVALLQKWVAELAEKTGRSLDEWIKHVKKSGPKSEKDCRVWLKEQYRLGTNTAGWLAEKAFSSEADAAEETPEGYLQLAPQYVEQMYVPAAQQAKDSGAPQVHR